MLQISLSSIKSTWEKRRLNPASEWIFYSFNSCIPVNNIQKFLNGTGAEENSFSLLFQKMTINLNQPKKPLKKEQFLLLLSDPFHLFWLNDILKKSLFCLQNLWSYMNHTCKGECIIVKVLNSVLDEFQHSFHFARFDFYKSLTGKDPPLLEILTNFSKPPLLLQPPNN